MPYVKTERIDLINSKITTSLLLNPMSGKTSTVLCRSQTQQRVIANKIRKMTLGIRNDLQEIKEYGADMTQFTFKNGYTIRVHSSMDVDNIRGMAINTLVTLGKPSKEFLDCVAPTFAASKNSSFVIVEQDNYLLFNYELFHMSKPLESFLMLNQTTLKAVDVWQ